MHDIVHNKFRCLPATQLTHLLSSHWVTMVKMAKARGMQDLRRKTAHGTFHLYRCVLQGNIIMQLPPRENHDDLYVILNWFSED